MIIFLLVCARPAIVSLEVVEQLAVVAPYSLDLVGGHGAVARRTALGRLRLRLPRGGGAGGRASGAQGLVHDVLPPQHIRQELRQDSPVEFLSLLQFLIATSSSALFQK